jgi:hypothetical protein
MQMDQIGDNRYGQAVVGQPGTEQAGLTLGEWRHRVAKVSNQTGTRGCRAECLLRAAT